MEEKYISKNSQLRSNGKRSKNKSKRHKTIFQNYFKFGFKPSHDFNLTSSTLEINEEKVFNALSLLISKITFMKVIKISWI